MSETSYLSLFTFHLSFLTTVSSLGPITGPDGGEYSAVGRFIPPLAGGFGEYLAVWLSASATLSGANKILTRPAQRVGDMDGCVGNYKKGGEDVKGRVTRYWVIRYWLRRYPITNN